MTEETNCPMCGNHCPKDALQCGRGRSYFNGEVKEGGKGHGHGLGTKIDTDNELVLALNRVAGVSAHKAEMMQAHDKDPQEMFACLTEEEQDILLALLEKLGNTWKAEHEARHAKH